MRLPAFVCLSVRLSVCLSVSKITKNACMDLDEMLRANRHRDMDELINFLSQIRIIFRTLEPDCFIRYRMRCNAEFYYVGKIPHAYWRGRSLQRGVVLKRFYSPRAVGTPLSEVRALYRVPF